MLFIRTARPNGVEMSSLILCMGLKSDPCLELISWQSDSLFKYLISCYCINLYFFRISTSQPHILLRNHNPLFNSEGNKRNSSTMSQFVFQGVLVENGNF